MNIYKVKLARKSEKVSADYFKIENGVVTFRNTASDHGYPQFVKCYAAGSWFSIENIGLDAGK